jgi:hypothetical protein
MRQLASTCYGRRPVRAQFIASPSLGPQQFVELGMDCLRIPMLGPLDDKGHKPRRNCRQGNASRGWSD